MKNVITWGLSIFVAVVFVQSLFFKFTGSQETVIIFNTIGDWMSSIGLPDVLATTFADIGGYGVGLVELIAAGFILIPATRSFGAAIGLAVMSGAVFFHLFTPLGVDRVIDQAGNTDGGALFYTAVGVLVSCIIILLLNRSAPASA